MKGRNKYFISLRHKMRCSFFPGSFAWISEAVRPMRSRKSRFAPQGRESISDVDLVVPLDEGH